MEEHFLKDFVSGLSRKAGPPEPWYNPDGDCLIYQTTDEGFVAERIDGSLTIYRSVENGTAIGFQIKGVLAIVQRFGFDGIKVEWSEAGKELTRCIHTCTAACRLRSWSKNDREASRLFRCFFLGFVQPAT